MAGMPPSSASTPLPSDFSSSVRLWWATAALLLLPVAWDLSGLDGWVMQHLADGSGFPLRHQWWLERVLHDAVRHLATVLYIGVLWMVWRPVGPFRCLARVQRVEVAVGVTLGLLAVRWIKLMSLSSCPWDLQAFGGVAHYVPHWHWGVPDGGPGQCFPGGHASAALAFLALALPWITSGRAEERRLGRQWLLGVLAGGLVLGLAQTLRGAHFPSHTLWTALVCWGVAVANHQAFRWLRPRLGRLRADRTVQEAVLERGSVGRRGCR